MTNLNFNADQISVSVELINPTTAHRYLQKNFATNRILSKHHVSNLASDMNDGSFVIGTDCIAFDEVGRLINGQHRLSAVVKSETIQPFIVVRGLPMKVAQMIDGGKRRTMSERVTIGGVRMTEKECAVVRNAMNDYKLATAGVVEYRDKKYDKLVADVFIAYSDFFENEEIRKHLLANSNAFFGAAALKMYAQMCADTGFTLNVQKRVIHWLELTAKGYSENEPTTPADTAAIALRNMRNKKAVDERGARWSKKPDYRLTLSAAFSFMNGFTVKNVKAYKDDPFVSIFTLADSKTIGCA